MEKLDLKTNTTEKLPETIEARRINGVELLVLGDYEKMSQLAAEKMHAEIEQKPDLLLCTATGSTPTRAYDLLVENRKTHPSAFEKLRMIKLDEWGGIPADDPATCETYLQKHLVQPLNIAPERFISFQSNPAKPKQEIKRVAKQLKEAGDIDLCILGMGVNGHLGFNEPATALKAGAHIAKLTDTTKKHTMAQEAEHEIGYGLTLGLNDIMRSKKIILLVNGSHKIEPFKKFLSGKITSRFPASMLWMHPNVTVICDKEAVPELPKK